MNIDDHLRREGTPASTIAANIPPPAGNQSLRRGRSFGIRRSALAEMLKVDVSGVGPVRFTLVD
jgi:hypothetical protein